MSRNFLQHIRFPWWTTRAQLKARHANELAKLHAEVRRLNRDLGVVNTDADRWATNYARKCGEVERLEAQLAERAQRDVSVAEARLAAVVEHEQTVAGLRPAFETKSGNASYPPFERRKP